MLSYHFELLIGQKSHIISFSEIVYTMKQQTSLLKKDRNLILFLALMCVLLMQFVYQNHQYDGPAHDLNDICKVCLKLSSLDSGHKTPDISFFDSTMARIVYRFVNISLDELIIHRRIYLRGPPQVQL